MGLMHVDFGRGYRFYTSSTDVTLYIPVSLYVIFYFKILLLGPFYGAIAVPSVTRCRCRRHCCCGH